MLLNRLRLLSRNSLVRDTAQLSIGQGLKLAIQATYFILIARSLGPASYGAFVAITALTNILAPFSGLGSSNLFVKNVRAGVRTSTVCWGNGLLVAVLSGGGLIALAMLGNRMFHLDGDIGLFLAICFSDLILMRIVDLAAFGFAAVGKMSENAIQNVAVSASRLVAIALLSIGHHGVSLSEWVLGYLVTGFFATGYALWRAQRIWGPPEFDLGVLKRDVTEGIFFSIGTSAQSIYNDVDKTMLGKLADFAATGIYGAAYRLIDVSLTPVRSLASAAYPEFFRRGVNGPAETYRYALKLIRKSALMGSAIFVGLWCAAGLFPLILGPKYANVAPAVRILAAIPLLRCVHLFLADSLSGAGFQGLRTGIQAAVAMLNVALNLLILPRWSWRGAAWTSIGCDAALALLLWVACRTLSRRHPTLRHTQPALSPYHTSVLQAVEE